MTHHEDSPLAGLAVVLTGAGSGIGRATARLLADSGANVLAVGRRREALEETAGDSPLIVPFPADLREPASAREIVAAADERWGRLDSLVNNAGVFVAMPLDEASAESIHDLLATNILAPSMLASAALPLLKQSRGSILNVSSTFGHVPAPGAAHYGASKAAIEHLTRSWALELAPHGVRVNAIAPGPTESDALHASGMAAATIEAIKLEEARRVPLGRRGEPHEIARWMLPFIDPASSWMTGQVLAVDGGLALT